MERRRKRGDFSHYLLVTLIPDTSLKAEVEEMDEVKGQRETQ